MDALLKGLLLGLTLVFSVGPVIFTILKQSIINGRHGGFSFVAGVWLSDIIFVILSNAFSELLSSLMNHERTIAVLGGVFLMSMGAYYLFFKKIHLKQDQEKIKITKSTQAKLFVSGFLINTLNPAVLFFWLGMGAAFATKLFKERLIIFATCLLLNISADIFKVILADKLAKRLNEKNVRIINKVNGLILFGFGVSLIIIYFFFRVKP